MANYQLLKADIDAKVYQNGRQEITGENLNAVLNAMVTTLGAEYQFAGVATTATNPGTPDAKVFYIANGKGTYTNFGSLEVTEDEVVVLYWDTEWHKEATGIASNEKLTELEVEVSGVRYSKNIPSSTQNAIIGETTLKSGLSYNIKFNIDVVPLNEFYFRFKDSNGNNVPLKINGEIFTDPFYMKKGETEKEYKNISVDIDSEINITYITYEDIYSGTATISAYLETGLKQEVEQLEYDHKQLDTRFNTQIGDEMLAKSTITYNQGDAQRGATKNTAGDIVVTTSPNRALWQLVISVIEGQTISINGYGSDSYRLWALVDNNGHIISKSAGDLDATSTPQLVSVKNDCTLIVSCFDNYISSLKVVVHTIGLAKLTRQSYKMFESIFYKKMYFVGDSIMIGRPNEEDTLNITTHIANMTSSNCVNLARGGSLFMYPWALGNQNSIYQQLTQVPSDADCVIVQGGVNGVEMTDPSKINYAPMGEISDSFEADFNKATQIGCLEAICKYLHENFCGKKVGFIMTYQIGDYNYWKNKAVKFAEVLDKWSIPVLDWRCSGVSLASSSLSRMWGYDTQNYPLYDPSKGYAVDDCVIYNDSAYKCNVTIPSPAGSFDSSKWTKITGTRYDNWHCNGIAYKKLANITAHWIATL